MIKKILKFFGYFLLVLVLIFAIYAVWRQYNYDWKFSGQLDDFTAEGMPYAFKDGKLSLDTSDPLKLTILNKDDFSKDSISNRKIQSLNGIWQVEEGDWETMPTNFGHQVPVPGLMDLATPKFEFPKYGQNQNEINVIAEMVTPWRSSIPIFIDEARDAFWYKKTFNYEGEKTDVIILKIYKAKYHTAVWLNGEKIGENPHNFAPGYFDVSKAIKTDGENELAIRIGASMSGYQGKGTFMDGYDMEKIRYYPGIYDDVELISSGTMTINNIQVAPVPDAQKLKIAVWLDNHADSGNKEELEISIRDYQNPDSILHQAKTESLRVVANGKRQVYFELPFDNAQLWSPENPNLYTLTVKSSNDELTTRFGMREFHFDETTKLPTLNGKTTFLRGSNICFFRFAEDPTRGTKAWDKDWVRRVFKQCKSMQWNILRFCIGSPPEFWYRIADEEGIMIVDEAPIWSFFREINLDAATLVQEYTAQMQAHWNYPSIVIWDAQNESFLNPPTLMALKAVRGIDMSDRAWDNGWGYPDRATDPYEEHVYPHQKNFAGGKPGLYDLNQLDSLNYTSYMHLNIGNFPLIVNEYAWLWLQRDGTPTELTKKGYDFHLPNATADDRFEFWNYRHAALTESMRARRTAGVLHFCALGHSYPGCYTSDNFTDLESLHFEPHFEKYIKSAFSPLGLCIWDWKEQVEAGTTKNIMVKVYNDDVGNWSGKVQLQLTKGEEIVTSIDKEISNLNIAALKDLTFELAFPTEKGAYQLMATLEDIRGKQVQSIRKLVIE